MKTFFGGLGSILMETYASWPFAGVRKFEDLFLVCHRFHLEKNTASVGNFQNYKLKVEIRVAHTIIRKTIKVNNLNRYVSMAHEK